MEHCAMYARTYVVTNTEQRVIGEEYSCIDPMAALTR